MLNTGLTAEQVAAATKVVPIDSVRPHPRNPNRGSVPAVRESLRSHGIFRSIVVQQSTGYVLAGNTTWAASKAEGLAEVPIIELPVSDDEAVKIMLVDNRAAQIGDGYDDMVLAELLRELPDLEGTGWEPAELDALLEEMATALDEGEDDATPQVPADAVTRPGDVWLLGPHRLVVGDSTDTTADIICRRFEEHTGVTPLRVRDGGVPVPVSFTAAPAAAV